MKSALCTGLFSFVILFYQAQVIDADPGNYTTLLSGLQPGDTLLLAPGTYTDGLNVFNLEGDPDLPIVIMGSGPSTVFEGNACCNTVSLKTSAYVVIRDFKIDGLDIPYIDAVKAEGTDGNWTHHITIENLDIVNHDGAPLTVGISTKCTSWDWIIRGNRIVEAGVGMYLGNSDGSAPFVNGIVEYNLIVDPVRYCMQIKHQNEGTRDIPGMTLNGKTIIRHNVLSKAGNSDPATARPNLLVGNFPASGDGENDYYEIYGNFLWQNPSEGLFQGTGNFAFYNNLLVNHQPGGWGFFSFPHNNFAPRNIHVFNNTIASSNWGIEINNPSSDFEQIVRGNAIFSANPLELDALVIEEQNITSSFGDANNYVVNVTEEIDDLDLSPLATLQTADIPFSEFSLYEDFDVDFDGNTKGWDFRGAYANIGAPLWDLELTQIPFPTSIKELVKGTLGIFPNPCTDSFTLEGSGSRLFEVRIFSLSGELAYTSAIREGSTLQIPFLKSGVYIVCTFLNGQVYSQRLVKM